MSSTTSYDSSPWPSRIQPGPMTAAYGQTAVQADHGGRRAKQGLRRRWRERATTTWACPGCELPVTDLVAAGVGFCPNCQEFTGLCGAGRKIICPDVMTWTTWHTPCTSRGVTAWQIADGGTQRVLLLCPQHDEQLRVGQAGWIRHAIRFESPAGR